MRTCSRGLLLAEPPPKVAGHTCDGDEAATKTRKAEAREGHRRQEVVGVGVGARSRDIEAAIVVVVNGGGGEHSSLQLPSQDDRRCNPSPSSGADEWVVGPRDERPSFQDSRKPDGASSLTNMHPPHLLKEHAGAPRAVAPPCTEAASPPRAGVASPQWVWAAAPPQAWRAGAAAPSRARWAGAVAPPPSSTSLMAHLTPCTCLRKKKLLDSLLGDLRRWC
jgi:hypothetical protein